MVAVRLSSLLSIREGGYYCSLESGINALSGNLPEAPSCEKKNEDCHSSIIESRPRTPGGDGLRDQARQERRLSVLLRLMLRGALRAFDSVER